MTSYAPDDVLSSPGPRTSQLEGKEPIRMPSWMAEAAPEGLGMIEARLAPRGLTLGPILGHGAMGVVFSIMKPGQRHPTGLVAKLTFDELEAHGTQTILGLGKKPSNRPKLRGVPTFEGIWRGVKKYRFDGDGFHGRYPIYAVIREDLLPITDFKETTKAYSSTGASRLLANYEIDGERFMNHVAMGETDDADSREAVVRSALNEMGKMPQMKGIAESLAFLLSAPMVIHDLHYGNIGFRPTETFTDWKDRYGNTVLQDGPKLVILDVGFSMVHSKPRIPKGIAANPWVEPPMFNAVLESIPYG